MPGRSRSSFGPGAYVVRYAWWSPIVPAAVGAALIAGFVAGELRRPARDRCFAGPHAGAGDWVMYAVRCLMPLAGLALLVPAAAYVRPALRSP